MEQWQDLAVDSTAPMKDVLATIDRGRRQIALVVDDGCHLLGTVTDGDIRRAILRGESLETPASKFMNAHPVTGLVDESPAAWQRAMQRHTLRHLPLIDANGCIRGMVRFEIATEPLRENPVIIMAGGMGTRLRPITENIPKPLVPVGGKPILETIIENFRAQGFYRLTLCINYKGEMIRDHFGDGARWDCEITYTEESKRLGTAGALSLLPKRPDDSFFVMNGDVLTKVDFVRLLEFHKKLDAGATMCIRDFSYQVPFGVVELDGYRVRRMVEKPTHHFYVNAGIYVLEPGALELVPGDRFFDMPSLFQSLMDRQTPVGSFPLRDYWIDVGQQDTLRQAGNDFGVHFGE